MRLVQQTKLSLGKAWVHIEPWSPEPCRAVEAQSRVGRAVGKAKEEVGETRQQWATEACNKVLHCAAKCNTGQQCTMMMCSIGKNAQQLTRVCMRGNWMRVSPVFN